MISLLKSTAALLGVVLWLAPPSYAQVGEGQQDATRVLNEMSPDTLEKVQSLALIIQHNLNEGKLSESDIRQGLLSGQLRERLKQLNPEAGQLLNEISAAAKEGKGPSEESLMPLLGGVGISPNQEP